MSLVVIKTLYERSKKQLLSASSYCSTLGVACFHNALLGLDVVWHILLYSHNIPLHVLSSFLQDLHRRIDQTRPLPSLEDSQFHYGFNSKALQKVVTYWRNGFDWKKQVDKLNKYPHFKTVIEGVLILNVIIKVSSFIILNDSNLEWLKWSLIFVDEFQVSVSTISMWNQREKQTAYP